MNDRPYLSIVITGRNDNYGKDFNKRVETFLRAMKRHDARHPGLFELIFVEWNAPEDRPPVAEAFDWKGLSAARIITVPYAAHCSVPLWNKTPLFWFHAQNVGVRRAHAPFVLVTNPDIIFSDALIDFLARRELDSGCFYRIDRHDFKPESAFSALTEDVFSHAIENVIAVHMRWLEPCVEASRLIEGKPMEQWPQSLPLPGDAILEAGVHQSRNKNTPHYGLHLNAAGDFLLMNREAWKKVRGYGERPEYTTQLDGLIVSHAAASGLQQIILNRPYIIMHMDHSREEKNTRPDHPYAVTHDEIVAAMNDGILKLNDENWGMADMAFEENRFGPQFTGTKVSGAFNKVA